MAIRVVSTRQRPQLVRKWKMMEPWQVSGIVRPMHWAGHSPLSFGVHVLRVSNQAPLSPPHVDADFAAAVTPEPPNTAAELRAQLAEYREMAKRHHQLAQELQKEREQARQKQEQLQKEREQARQKQEQL